MPNFPTTPNADERLQAVNFQIMVDGTEVRCLASREFFETHFNANAAPESWIAAYHANAQRINEIAAASYRRDGISPVLLHTEDH